MPFSFVSVEEAIKRSGVRMVVVGDVPSPWGEAAKGILHIKGIVAKYLGKKYGYRPEAGAAAGPRVADLLCMLMRLNEQRHAGSRYYVGNSLTAADVYSATFAAMFDPLPPEQCRMDASTRAAFSARDTHTDAASAPILFEHRDMMYREFLELPLSL